MAKTWTADEIIAAARRIYFAPGALSPLGITDADVLSMINEYVESELYGEIMAVREDYYHVQVDTSITAGVSYYRINPRAMYQRLVNVNFLDSSGNEVKPFDRLDTTQVSDRSNDTSDTPSGYLIEGNYIRIWPDLSSSASGTLRQVIFFRPGELVLSADVRVVDSVNTATGAITLTSAAPASWSVTNTFDIHSAHSGAEIKAWDKTASVVSGTSMTVANIDGSVSGEKAVEAGDYVCLANEAGLPGVPREFHAMLAQAAAVAMAEQFKDADAVAIHNGRLVAKLRRALENIVPRVDADRKKIRGTRFIGAQGAWYGRGSI